MQHKEMKAIIEKATFQIILSNLEQQILPNLILSETTKLLLLIMVLNFF